MNNNVIKLIPRKNARANNRIIFSADVYSFDKKKYQYETQSWTITEAYNTFVKSALLCGIPVIRCVAIYKGQINQRIRNPVPLKVWQQNDPIFGKLIEY